MLGRAQCATHDNNAWRGSMFGHCPTFSLSISNDFGTSPTPDVSRWTRWSITHRTGLVSFCSAIDIVWPLTLFSYLADMLKHMARRESVSSLTSAVNGTTTTTTTTNGHPAEPSIKCNTSKLLYKKFQNESLNETTYNLYGVCCHHGNMLGGHYTGEFVLLIVDIMKLTVPFLSFLQEPGRQLLVPVWWHESDSRAGWCRPHLGCLHSFLSKVISHHSLCRSAKHQQWRWWQSTEYASLEFQHASIQLFQWQRWRRTYQWLQEQHLAQQEGARDQQGNKRWHHEEGGLQSWSEQTF